MYESIQVKSNLFRIGFKPFSSSQRKVHLAELENQAIDSLQYIHDN